MNALISVSDKTGIVEFATQLHSLGVTILSTGGTATTLVNAGIPVTKVADVTGFPEILDGRVKTLHPKIHGGLLGVPSLAQHVAQMAEHGIEKIDLAVINLYPFEQTLARAGATDAEIIENIDIGGPAMVRAAAKNFEHTCVVVNPSRYAEIIGLLTATDTSKPITSAAEVPMATKRALALEAFSHTAQYDARISGYFANTTNTMFPIETAAPMRLDIPLRYGENPHQQAALYGRFTKIFTTLHGKELSYNNILDIDASAKLCSEFTQPTVCIFKHTNPCGVAQGSTLVDAWDAAFATDTVSPFGGIVCVNREVTLEFAEHIHSIFTEVIIAPSFTADALERLTKKKDRRLVTINTELFTSAQAMDMRSVTGGLLLQQADVLLTAPGGLNVVTERKPTQPELDAMEFAWKVAKHVKSNAIVYALADRTLAIGAGQMSRVDSARIAVQKARDAGLSLDGCAVASDAFFPFADGLLQAAEAGATCVIQPGGSVRDAEVIQAANENNLAMVFTGMRHFRH